MAENKRYSITYVNDTGREDFSVYVSGMPYVSSSSAGFFAWLTLRAQSSAAFLFPASSGVGFVWEGVTYGPAATPPSATWEVVEKADMDLTLQQVGHQRSSGNIVVIKNLTRRPQLTVGIFKSKKLFLAKKEVQPNTVYRFNITTQLFFNAGIGGDVDGQNFRVNVADYIEGVVVTVKQERGEFVFSAANPDMARAIFRKEDHQALHKK